jgi:hypothetical protein
MNEYMILAEKPVERAFISSSISVATGANDRMITEFKMGWKNAVTT